MKKLKLLLLGIVSILGIGISFADFSIDGQLYENGVYHNPGLGLITFIYSGDIITLQDKNLGATEVYDGLFNGFGSSFTSGNWVYSNCSQLGNLYQFGNNTPFDCNSYFNNTSLSIINLDSTSYSWNGTHLNLSGVLYNPSTFQTSSKDIWGGETGTPISQQAVCPDGYYIPNSSDISIIYNDLVGFFGGTTSMNNSSPAAKGHIAIPFVQFAYYFKVPSRGGFSSTLNRNVRRFSFLSSTAPFYYYQSSSSNGLLNTNILAFTDSSYSSYPNRSYLPYIEWKTYRIGFPLLYPVQSYSADISTSPFLTSVRCFKNIPVLPDNSWVSLSGGDTSLLPDPEEIPDPNDPWADGTIDLTGYNISSLYYNCLGPYYNTSDGLPPAYCYNSSGELDSSRFENCFDTIESIDTGFIYHTYCYIDGYQQEINIVEDGSGYSIVPGNNNTNFLDYFNSGYTIDYFENFLNKTGYFFKCPFPYTQNLVIWPKLISLLGGYDLALPANCAFAGFEKGKNFITFDSGSSSIIQGGPILNGDSDNQNLLFRFFDLLLILGFIFSLGRIFKVFK